MFCAGAQHAEVSVCTRATKQFLSAEKRRNAHSGFLYPAERSAQSCRYEEALFQSLQWSLQVEEVLIHRSKVSYNLSPCCKMEPTLSIRLFFDGNLTSWALSGKPFFLSILRSCYKCNFIVGSPCESSFWFRLPLGTAISHLGMKWVALLQCPGRRSIWSMTFSRAVSVQTAVFFEEHKLDVLVVSLNGCPKLNSLVLQRGRG